MPAEPAEVTASYLADFDSAFPLQREWDTARPVYFSHDWQGQNDDPDRGTEVRVLWADHLLFVRFVCRYRTIDVFPDADPTGRRDELWDRDVAEVFLQPDRFGEKYYKEFEVSPNCQWLDLQITPQGLTHINSGMRIAVRTDEYFPIWTAILAIPMVALTRRFDPDQPWRVNFFRCEGREPQRFYSAWQPTGTPRPDFHVPQKFGTLRFHR